MALVLNNSLTEGISGMVGDQCCYRTRGNKTFLVKRPVSRKGKIPPPTQAKTHNSFRAAVAFGQYAKADPELGPLYEIAVKKKKTEYASVYHAAMRDALTPPELLPLRNHDFKGRPGDTLTINAKDIIPLSNLRFSFQYADGRELEAGMAITEKFEGDFSYTCHTLIDDLENLLIVVTTIDMPGRIFPEEFPFPQFTFRVKDFSR